MGRSSRWERCRSWRAPEPRSPHGTPRCLRRLRAIRSPRADGTPWSPTSTISMPEWQPRFPDRAEAPLRVGASEARPPIRRSCTRGGRSARTIPMRAVRSPSASNRAIREEPLRARPTATSSIPWERAIPPACRRGLPPNATYAVRNSTSKPRRSKCTVRPIAPPDGRRSIPGTKWANITIMPQVKAFRFASMPITSMLPVPGIGRPEVHLRFDRIFGALPTLRTILPTAG